MVRSHQVTTSGVEWVVDSCVERYKSLGLSKGFELSHPSFPDPGRFMRLLGSIILILLSAMNHIRHQLSISNAITLQFVGHYLPGFTAMTPQQTKYKTGKRAMWRNFRAVSRCFT
jgi:hypothetical protein